MKKQQLKPTGKLKYQCPVYIQQQNHSQHHSQKNTQNTKLQLLQNIFLIMLPFLAAGLGATQDSVTVAYQQTGVLPAEPVVTSKRSMKNH